MVIHGDGIGENSSFYTFHPIVGFVYFSFVIAIACMSNHPVFLFVTVAFGLLYSIILKGLKSLKSNLKLLVIITFFSMLLNGLFSHNGQTVLFYLNTNRITLEAITYGAVISFMIVGLIIWFGALQVILSPDKFIYLFGRISPVFALLFSMIFRYIPLLQRRFKSIQEVHRLIGKAGIRQTFKELSVLISWSMENSIETADSMEARGYGLKGRTSFNLFLFRKRDGILLALIIIMGTIAFVGAYIGGSTVYYFPGYFTLDMGMWYGVTLSSYIALLIIPIAVDIYGELRWKQFFLKM